MHAGQYLCTYGACWHRAASERARLGTCSAVGVGARLPHVSLAVVQRLQPQDAGERAEDLAASEEPDEPQWGEAAQLEGRSRLAVKRLAHAHEREQQRGGGEARRAQVGGAQRGAGDAGGEDAPAE